MKRSKMHQNYFIHACLSTASPKFDVFLREVIDFSRLIITIACEPNDATGRADVRRWLFHHSRFTDFLIQSS